MTRSHEEQLDALYPEYEAIAEAKRRLAAARAAYAARADELGYRLCYTCSKPMGDYDHSMNCDYCNVPWVSPEERAAQKIERQDLLREKDRIAQRLSELSV
jgi:hypothetical protein